MRGRRERRVPGRTHSLMCKVKKHMSVITTGKTEASAFPAQWFDGLLRALVSAKFARVCERAVLTNRPSLDLSPLDKFAGDLRATHPDFVYTPHGLPQVLHNSGRLAWGSGPKGETPQYTGVDFIIARDGKIAALYVYLDSTPA